MDEELHDHQPFPTSVSLYLLITNEDNHCKYAKIYTLLNEQWMVTPHKNVLSHKRAGKKQSHKKDR